MIGELDFSGNKLDYLTCGRTGRAKFILCPSVISCSSVRYKKSELYVFSIGVDMYSDTIGTDEHGVHLKTTSTKHRTSRNSGKSIIY